MNDEIKKTRGIYTILTYLVVFYLVAIIVQLAVVAVIKGMGMDITSLKVQTLASSWTNFATYIVLFIGLFYFQKTNLLDDWKAFKQSQNKLFAILGGFAIFYVISLFFQNMILSIEQNINFGYQLMGINKTINSTSDNQSVIEEMMRSSGAIPMFLSAVVIGPICEELVFRKAIFDVFKKPEIAIIVSSITFGLIHIISSIGISTPLELCLMTIPYVSSGIAFGYIYIRYKQNIWIPIIAHTLSNFISMIGIIFLI